MSEIPPEATSLGHRFTAEVVGPAPIPADPPRWLSGTIGGSRALVPNEAGLDRLLDSLFKDTVKRENRIRRLCEAGYTVDQAAAVYDLVVELACDWKDGE